MSAWVAEAGCGGVRPEEQQGRGGRGARRLSAMRVGVAVASVAGGEAVAAGGGHGGLGEHVLSVWVRG